MVRRSLSVVVIFFKDTATTEIYTLSLHDALPISNRAALSVCGRRPWVGIVIACARSEEHTSELQSRGHLVCRLLLEKKKKIGDYFIFVDPELFTHFNREGW